MRANKVLFIVLSLWLGHITSHAQPDKSISNKEAGAAFFLVGRYVESNKEAIKIYQFDGQTGNTEYLCGLKGIPNPAFLTSSSNGERIYAIGDDNGEKSTVNALCFDKETGRMSLLNSQSTNGELPIYITLSSTEDFVLTANYMGAASLHLLWTKKAACCMAQT